MAIPRCLALPSLQPIRKQRSCLFTKRTVGTGAVSWSLLGFWLSRFKEMSPCLRRTTPLCERRVASRPLVALLQVRHKGSDLPRSMCCPKPLPVPVPVLSPVPVPPVPVPVPHSFPFPCSVPTFPFPFRFPCIPGMGMGQR